MRLEFVEAPHPLGNTIDYFEERDLRIGIRNHADAAIVVDEIALVFQAAHPSVPEEFVTVRHPCKGQVREPSVLHYERIEVRPSLMLYSPTNAYRIVVTYRTRSETGFSKPTSEVIGERYFIRVMAQLDFRG